MRLAFVLAAILGLAGTAAASEFSLRGQARQGGLMIGKAGPGAKVSVNGHALRVSPDGEFIFGFGRDAPRRWVLKVVHADGAENIREILVMPRAYRVQRIDGLPPRQVTPSAEDLKRIRAEGAEVKAARQASSALTAFAGTFAWPAQGPISGVYGSQRILNGKPRRPHLGLDVAGPQGGAVTAAAAGVVALAHSGMFFNGKIVILDHGHGLTSVYMHLSGIAVKKGDRVARGALIGRIGKTGRVTGPHLHWGVSLFDTYVDPALLVPPR